MSLGYLLKSEIAGLYCMGTFNVRRLCLTFPNGTYQFTPLLAMSNIFCCSPCWPTVVSDFNFSQSSKCKMDSHNFIILIINDVEHHLIFLLDIMVYYFVNNLFKTFNILFFYLVVYFFKLICRSYLYILTLVLCPLYVLHIFFPTLSLIFW